MWKFLMILLLIIVALLSMRFDSLNNINLTKKESRKVVILTINYVVWFLVV